MTTSWFARTTVFAAQAARSEGDDADLPKGTHLRVFPSPDIGFPLAPLGVWTVPAQRIAPLDLDWFDLRERAMAAPDLDAAGGEVFGVVAAALANDASLVGVEMRLPGGAFVAGGIGLLDRIDRRVVSQRSRLRWLVGAPDFAWVRLRGRGVAAVDGWAVVADHAFERIVGAPPVDTLSAPIAGDAPWYAGGAGPASAMDRVRSGAPLRLAPPDRPDGPFDALTPASEEARLEAFRAALEAEFALMVGDPDTPPALVEQVHTWLAADLSPGKRRPWQRVRLNLRDGLVMKSIDPGAARYLGLMTRLDFPPDPVDAAGLAGATACITAGAFACNRLDPLRAAAPDAFERRLLDRLIALTPGLRRAADRATRSGLEVRVFVAPALAAPLPDRPEAPTLALGAATWLRADAGPSTEFRQQLMVERPPMAPLVALGRLAAEGWQSRHELDGEPPRAATRLLGLPDAQRGLYAGRRGLIDDTPVPAEAAPWTYRVALGDVYGRFGAATDITVPLPARPPLPAPSLRAQYVAPPRTAHRELADAGTVRLQVDVPASDRLTAGSRLLAQVTAGLDGAASTQAAPAAGGTLDFEFAAPGLLPMETRRLQATARVEDTDGAAGPTATIDVDIADGRAPLVPQTGIGIVWSSRPGPAEDVEFKMRFDGVDGVRYRVYLSDARGLEIPAFEGDRPRTRAEVAVAGAQLGLAGVGLRDRFRLVTEQPLEPSAGSVLLATRLPRALETVQFLRFVPLSARGVEAEFADCPLLPIAVPADRPPPAPRVQVQVDADTGVAHIIIEAIGLDLVALRVAEPGLFDAPPTAGAHAPSWRLRRASGTVPDAIYAREIGRGALAFDGEAFTATVDDAPTPDGLLPYVRWFYWADVRLPAERRLPPDVLEIALPAGAVQPLQPAQVQDAPGAASPPSAPAMAVFVPAAVPALAAEQCTATVADSGGGTWLLTLAVVGGPVAHQRAVGRYGVTLHIQIDGGDLIAEPAALPFEDGALGFTKTGAGAPPTVRIAVVLTDPVGRAAAPLFVDAVAV